MKSKYLIILLYYLLCFSSCTDNELVSENLISEYFDDVAIIDTINYTNRSLSYKKDTISILAVGNSFSKDAIEQHLVDIAKSDDVVFLVGNLNYPAAGLDLHWYNAINNKTDYIYYRSDKGYTKNISIEMALNDYNWEYISLQQVSNLSGISSSFSPYLENLINYIKNKSKIKTKIVLHQTWAYSYNSKHPGFSNYKNDQILMFKNIIESYSHWEKYKDIYMRIPAGTAIQNARTTFLGSNLTLDGYHLDQRVGQYLAALTWYEKLTNNNVVGNKYIPKNVTKSEIVTIQKSAHAAIINPNNITLIK